jgi:DNA-binding response OmpR family regulator
VEVNTVGVVLVVDDDPVFRALATAVLSKEGHTVVAVSDANAALDSVVAQPPDLIVLDIELPGMSGLELLTRLRVRTNAPFIIVSSHEAETERVLAFDLGADDYVVKPILHREFAARVRTSMRRARASAGGILRFEGLEIRLAAREVIVRGEPVAMTRREFDLLAYLATRAGQVVSRQQLLNDIWDLPGQFTDSATLTEHIRRVRKKIELDPTDPRYIRGVRNVGYSFQAPPHS